MTNLTVSQVVRQSTVEVNPALRVSQIARQSTVFPNIPLKISQTCRMTTIQAPQPTILYCWARQIAYPGVTAVTPVLVSAPLT